MVNGWWPARRLRRRVLVVAHCPGCLVQAVRRMLTLGQGAAGLRQITLHRPFYACTAFRYGEWLRLVYTVTRLQVGEEAKTGAHASGSALRLCLRTSAAFAVVHRTGHVCC